MKCLVSVLLYGDNEPLDLGMCSLIWRQIKMYVHSLYNILFTSQ
jgi:hypothetical protein